MRRARRVVENRSEPGPEAGIERVLLGHCVAEVVYDCR
jgi:hypothetical protein